jgi:hypothetical protein
MESYQHACLSHSRQYQGLADIQRGSSHPKGPLFGPRQPNQLTSGNEDFEKETRLDRQENVVGETNRKQRKQVTDLFVDYLTKPSE